MISSVSTHYSSQEKLREQKPDTYDLEFQKFESWRGPTSRWSNTICTNEEINAPKFKWLVHTHTHTHAHSWLMIQKISHVLCKIRPFIREMHIKTTLRYHLTPFRTGIIRKSTNNKCWRGCGEKENSLHCWWEGKLVQPLWKTEWRFLKKQKIE